MTLSICIAQFDFPMGDLPRNAQKIFCPAHEAYAVGARLQLAPERSPCGYACDGPFLRSASRAACDDAVKQAVAETAALKDPVMMLGHPHQASSAGAPAQCFRARDMAERLRVCHQKIRVAPAFKLFKVSPTKSAPLESRTL